MIIKIGTAAMLAALLAAWAQDPKPEASKAAPHDFLKQFVGEWTCDSEAQMAPDQEPVKSKGAMSGSMIGSFWAVVVVKGEMMGQPFTGQGTFGYDPNRKKYIGTWVDSMMNHLWLYEGTVEGNKLILPSDGPNPSDPSKPMKFRDTWEFKDKDTIVLTGEVQNPEGGWTKMMTATCTRKK